MSAKWVALEVFMSETSYEVYLFVFNWEKNCIDTRILKNNVILKMLAGNGFGTL